jgi:hypothetical protein
MAREAHRFDNEYNGSVIILIVSTERKHAIQVCWVGRDSVQLMRFSASLAHVDDMGLAVS